MVFAVAALLVSVGATAGWAHCDGMSGPVAQAALHALGQGDFASVQIWVGPGQEDELRARFDEALRVRQQGDAVREMADRYFIETAVRLHREAEGMPYTGVKPAAEPEPGIAAAERALESGDITDVTGYLSERMTQAVEEWFTEALEARERRDQSVEAGREWVDAYVKYIVFVETLDSAISEGPAHGVDGH
ncbi:MAG TPA: hypothetical protein DEP45_15185 [Armatimonadetes bacterium]|nr:hypothetical protein [Armatimonadota bacterium]